MLLMHWADNQNIMTGEPIAITGVRKKQTRKIINKTGDFTVSCVRVKRTAAWSPDKLHKREATLYTQH